MKTYQLNSMSIKQRQVLLKRPALDNKLELSSKVSGIISQVRDGGDQAIKDLTLKFDQANIKKLKVTEQEFEYAENAVSDKARLAILQAISNVTAFHSAQIPEGISLETSPGILCRQEFRPIEKVGLYVPGGSAPLISTVVMLAVPAMIAACNLKILCTPPSKDGKIDPHILLAAKLTGITEVFKVGGAQAIAAMAYGTESITKVYKIFGPGNSWVTEAKQQVAQDPDGAICDMPAGPSEVLVIADKDAKPSFVAADLLSQAEHGADSQSIILTDCQELAEKVKQELTVQLTKLSRNEIAQSSLTKGRIIICKDIEEAFSVSNEYGPEHLIVQTKNANAWSTKITNAGSVFLGPWSPESVGDYASGTNHVLPTYGYSKAVSGLSLNSFLKTITFQQLSQEGLLNIGPTVETLADIEGLDAHKNAVSLRLQEIRKVYSS